MHLLHALSDGLLATCALAAAAPLLRQGLPRRLAGAGLGLVGIAALVGTLRYLTGETLAPLHSSLGTLAGGGGVPAVGVALLLAARGESRPTVAWGALAALLALTATTRWLVPLPAVRTALGAAGLLLVLGVCATWGRRTAPAAALFGALGAVGTLVAGLAVGTQGSLGPIARLDIFHVLLAASALGLGYGASGIRVRRSRSAALQDR